MDGSPLSKVTEDALRLSDEERVELADRLRVSLLEHDEAVARAWTEVALRRVEDLRAGRTQAIPWEQAKARLLDNLAKRRLDACR